MSGTSLKNYYGIMGLPKEATSEQISKRYRELALERHPDKAKTDTQRTEFHELFIELQEAYAVLSDEHKRRLFDLSFARGDVEGFHSGVRAADHLSEEEKRERERVKRAQEEKLKRETEIRVAAEARIQAKIDEKKAREAETDRLIKEEEARLRKSGGSVHDIFRF